MAHPSIPKSEPQETSGVSLGASGGSSAPGSADFSETSIAWVDENIFNIGLG